MEPRGWTYLASKVLAQRTDMFRSTASNGGRFGFGPVTRRYRVGQRDDVGGFHDDDSSAMARRALEVGLSLEARVEWDLKISTPSMLDQLVPRPGDAPVWRVEVTRRKLEPQALRRMNDWEMVEDRLILWWAPRYRWGD